jgi:hypothetical protein
MDHARHAGAGEGTLGAAGVLVHAWAAVTTTFPTVPGTALDAAVGLEAWASDVDDRLTVDPHAEADDRWTAGPPAGADVHEEPWQWAEREQHARYG